MTNDIPHLYFSNSISENVLELFNREQFAQRSPEWYIARDGCISASDMGTALLQSEKTVTSYIELFQRIPEFSFKISEGKSCNSYSSQRDLILKKCNLGEPFTGNKYTLYGQKFEPVVSNIYSQLHQVDMLEFGLLIHPEYSFIGASPDGISTSGTMLEIKCPSSREVKPYPTFPYCIQMWMQLFVTGLARCDYFDAHFCEYNEPDIWAIDCQNWEQSNPNANHHIFGLLLTTNPDDEEEMKHIYAEPNIYKYSQFQEFLQKTSDELVQKDIPFTITYYKLHKYYISSVDRNDEWVRNNFQDMKDMWEKIQYHRTEKGLLELKNEIAKENDEKEAKKKEKERKQKEKEIKQKESKKKECNLSSLMMVSEDTDPICLFTEDDSFDNVYQNDENDPDCLFT